MTQTENTTPETAASEEGLAKLDRDRIRLGTLSLVGISGVNSKDHGFHDDWPVPGYPVYIDTGEPAAGVKLERIEEYKQQLRRAIIEKLDLIHEEIAEALGEVRSGRDPLEIYYSHTTKVKDETGRVTSEHIAYYDTQQYGPDGEPLFKPEGFLVEIADAFIRQADLTYLVGGGYTLVRALAEKHAFNATRPYKHGRKL